MTFPSIRSEDDDASVGNVTSHSVSLPPTVSAGDLLIAVLAADNNSATFTWDQATAGTWEPLLLLGQASGAPGLLMVYFKVADGTEAGLVLTVTSTLAETSVSKSWAFQNSGEPPAVASNSATTANPDPPNLAPSWGAQDNLWLALTKTDGGSSFVATAAPAGYGTLSTKTSGGATTGAGIAWAFKSANASSENPGTFTLTASASTYGVTIAIPPTGFGGARDARVSTVVAEVLTGANPEARVSTVVAEVLTLAAPPASGRRPVVVICM